MSAAVELVVRVHRLFEHLRRAGACRMCTGGIELVPLRSRILCKYCLHLCAESWRDDCLRQNAESCALPAAKRANQFFPGDLKIIPGPRVAEKQNVLRAVGIIKVHQAGLRVHTARA